jgi:hypothetical protein
MSKLAPTIWKTVACPKPEIHRLRSIGKVGDGTLIECSDGAENRKGIGVLDDLSLRVVEVGGNLITVRERLRDS